MIAPDTYGTILRDRRLSLGAFKLWHLLANMANRDGVCWPGQRRLAEELGCKPHSLRNWTTQLVRCGYIHTIAITAEVRQKYKLNRHHCRGFVYHVYPRPVPALGADDDLEQVQAPRRMMPKRATPKKARVMPKGATPTASNTEGDAHRGTEGVPLWGKKGDAQKGNVINTIELTSLNECCDREVVGGKESDSTSPVGHAAGAASLAGVGSDLVDNSGTFLHPKVGELLKDLKRAL